jgi:hypothetical protein
MDGYVLSEKDRDTLIRMFKEFEAKKNVTNRVKDDDEQVIKSVYVGQVQSGGITARSGMTPGRGICHVFEVDLTDPESPVLNWTGDTEYVYSLSDGVIEEESIVLLTREAYGAWLVASANTSEVWVKCGTQHDSWPMYNGVVIDFDETTRTWTEGATCYLLEANRDELTPDRRYPSDLRKEYGGKPLHITGCCGATAPAADPECVECVGEVPNTWGVVLDGFPVGGLEDCADIDGEYQLAWDEAGCVWSIDVDGLILSIAATEELYTLTITHGATTTTYTGDRLTGACCVPFTLMLDDDSDCPSAPESVEVIPACEVPDGPCCGFADRWPDSISADMGAGGGIVTLNKSGSEYIASSYVESLAGSPEFPGPYRLDYKLICREGFQLKFTVRIYTLSTTPEIALSEIYAGNVGGSVGIYFTGDCCPDISLTAPFDGGGVNYFDPPLDEVTITGSCEGNPPSPPLESNCECLDTDTIETVDVTLAGFSGTCSGYNGTRTLTRVGATCQYSYDSGGLTLDLFYDVENIILLGTLSGTSIAYGLDGLTVGYDCCIEHELDLIATTGCTAPPATVTVTSDCVPGPCIECSGSLPDGWTATLSGFADGCESFNGSWVFNPFAECEWRGVLNGKTLKIVVGGTGITVSEVTANEIVYAIIETLPLNCCTGWNVSQTIMSCGTGPTDFNITPVGC